MTKKPTKAYNVCFILLVALWLSVSWTSLWQQPNLFTVLVVDRWRILLPVFSVILLLMLISSGFPMGIVRHLLWLILGLVVMWIIVTPSIFLSVLIENNSSVHLSAVSVDLKNNHIRMVAIPPQEKKRVVLAKAESLEIAKGNGYHLFVYNDEGRIYFEKTLTPKQLDRINVIALYDIEDKLNSGMLWESDGRPLQVW